MLTVLLEIAKYTKSGLPFSGLFKTGGEDRYSFKLTNARSQA